MCGIAGVYEVGGDASVRRQAVREMTRRMVHRGPDQEGYFDAEDVSLGVRRLAVMSPETGSQPVCNEDATLHAVANGELYGFEAVQRRLVRRGHELRSLVDSEILVHLYEEHEDAMLQEIDGMFTFALWDARRRRLVIARDRFGIKPLFYSVDEATGRLAFASELPALLAMPGIDTDVHPAAVDRFFALSYVPQPDSLVRGVRKLAPGCVLLASDGRLEVRRYWRPEPPHSVPAPDALRELDSAIGASVETMMKSDRPVGSMLSGGLDSATIAFHMTRAAGRAVPTFTARFEEPEFDEGRQARAIAASLGTDHHEIWVAPDTVLELPRILSSFGEPFGDPAVVPAAAVARAARSDVTVLMSGEGGDELLGGYRWYRSALIAERASVVPAALTHLAAVVAGRLSPKRARFLGFCGLPLVERHEAWTSIFDLDERRRLFTREFDGLVDASYDRLALGPWYEAGRGDPDDAVARLQAVDVETYLVDNNLLKADHIGMAESLEVRVPFLSLPVYRAASALPLSLRVNASTTKVALRRIMRGRLPREVLDMRKRGFGVPLGRWLRGPLSEFVREMLAPERVAETGILRSVRVQELVHEHMSGARDRSRQLWSLLCFATWHAGTLATTSTASFR
ncbi:MAG: asparagine synthase (glutamine-hydrolyzing) [Planctomycetota bacterium]